VSVLEIRGVTAAYGSTEVLHGVDLDVPRGSITAILGASGSGKTTLLRAIAGFERPTSGTISIAGEVVAGRQRHVAPERRSVGYVAQDGALFPHLTVARNVAFGLRRSAHRNGRVAELLEMVELSPYAGRYPHELSGGQQQRVALARAMATNPPVVLLDEPFAALDAALRSDVRRDTTRVLKEAGTTTVLVTHDQHEALSMSDQLAVLAAGKIAQAGPPATLYQHPIDPGIASFLGDANLLPAVAEPAGLRTTLGLLKSQSPVPAGAVGTVLVRPEQICISLSPKPGLVAATIIEIEYRGHECFLTLTVDQNDRHATVVTRTPQSDRFTAGGEVAIGVKGSVHAWAADDTAHAPMRRHG
jgi:iron(III) transport system ATP-binding protein